METSVISMKRILMDDGRCWCDRLEQESFRGRVHLNTGVWGQGSHISQKKGIKE